MHIKVWCPGQGPRLKRFRLNAGLSQEAVAELTDVSWMTVLRWEHPDSHQYLRAIRYDRLMQLAALYKVTLAQMLPGYDASIARTIEHSG